MSESRGYDIDPTEVTAAQYKTFLDAEASIDGQPAYCAWNTSYAVVESDGDKCLGAFDPVTYPDVAVGCVDWCDARAYCAWRGRRLCGRIGGGAIVQELANDPEQGQWYRACSAAGARAFPYEGPFDPQRCKTSGSPGGAKVSEVKLLPGCEGGSPGLFDMSGNIQEWADSCNDGPDADDPSDDSCTVRGGAFWTDEVESRCDSTKYGPRRSWVGADWGFRCCSAG